MFPTTTRTLVVDDMMMMRSFVKTQLRNMGFTTVMDADNGQKAFEIINHQQGIGAPIQLVLCDWNMSVMTGIELLQLVRAQPQYKDLPFIMITAEGEVDQVKMAIESGVSSFIRKPITPAI